MKKRKILAAILISIGIISSSLVSSAENMTTIQNEEIYARAAVLMDADNGRVLFEKNGYEAMAMASTTKIMTCILALENNKLDEVVKVSAYAEKMPKVKLNIREGEYYYLGDLLYSLMLESHNDSAVAIAEHVAGDVKSFAQKMNEKAKEIGCENTYFITPNGLDASDETGVHSTSARDLALIMSYCIEKSPMKEEFLKITGEDAYSFSNLTLNENNQYSKGKRNFACNNLNAFMTMMEGVVSGKTGYTSDAGYCYVGAVKKDNKNFVVALLASGWPNNKNYKWKDAKKIMTYGMENYNYVDFSTLTYDFEIPKSIPVTRGKIETVGVGTKKDDIQELKGMVLSKEESIETEFKMKDTLVAPVLKNEEIGEINYKLNDNILFSEKIITLEEIEAIDFGWCTLKVLKAFGI